MLIILVEPLRAKYIDPGIYLLHYHNLSIAAEFLAFHHLTAENITSKGKIYDPCTQPNFVLGLPKQWSYIGDCYSSEHSKPPHGLENRICYLESFMTTKDIQSAYALYERLARLRVPDPMHGSCTRFKRFGLSSNTELFTRIRKAVDVFYTSQGHECELENVKVISEQLLFSHPPNHGQSLHIDAWKQYCTVVIYLTAGKSTKFGNTKYFDVGDRNMEADERYEFDWSKIPLIFWNVGPGDMTIFWSNLPHAAPDNQGTKDRIAYYAAFYNKSVKSYSVAAKAAELEKPIFQADYYSLATHKATPENRNFINIY